jgi:hypothetical protein
MFYGGKMKNILCIFGLVSFVSVSAIADQSEYLHQPYISARVQGMGGAFVGLADDYNALFFNPAGLARLESGEINLDLQIGGTPTILNLSSDIGSAGSDPQKLQTALANYYGSHFSATTGLGGTWVRPHWGVSLLPVNLTVEADIHGVGGATAGVQAYQDTLLQFGYAWNITEDRRFSFGIAPKAVYRAYFEKALSILDFSSSTQLFRPQDAEEGITVDADAGFLYTVDVPSGGFFKFLQYAKPQFGFAVRNIADEGFLQNYHLYGAQTSRNVDSKLERRFDVGSKWELPEFWVFKPRFLLDFRDMGTRYANFKKTSHVGGELLWKAFGWLKGGYRLGLSEGYVTAGVSAQLWIFLLDVATYSDDIGTSSAPKESRNYMVRLNADF